MNGPRDYENMTHEDLVGRLQAAEDVCVLYGWSAATSPDAGDRELATLQLWTEWYDVAGPGATSKAASPHLTDGVIHDLAEQRRQTRREVLARIREAAGVES